MDSNCWSAMSSTNGKTGNRIKNYMKEGHGQKKDIGDESKASAKNRFLSTDLQHFPTYGKRFNLALFVKFDSSWLNTKKTEQCVH